MKNLKNLPKDLFYFPEMIGGGKLWVDCITTNRKKPQNI